MPRTQPTARPSRRTPQPEPSSQPASRRTPWSARLAAHPARTLLGVLGFLVVAGVLGGPLAGALDGDGGFAPPDADSVTGVARLEQATGQEPSAGIVLWVRTPDGPTVDAARVDQVARRLSGVDGVDAVAAPRSADPATAPLVARDGRSVLVTGTLAASASDSDVAGEVVDAFATDRDVVVGGDAVASTQITDAVGSDLGRAEALAFPVLLLLSLLFFRGRAALLPLFVGVTTVLGTFLVLAGVNQLYGLSVFALNLVIGLGLGLAVDYSLFLVTRYREQLATGEAPTPAIRTTMRTAGRTVVFSAATVAAALVTLTVFPLGFLKSMGIAGAVVAVVGASSALVITPAFLGWCGPRLARRTPSTDTGGRWFRLAHAVLRRPGVVAAVTGALMLALAAPALGTHWSPIDSSVIPVGQSARTVADATSRDFDGAGSLPTTVALTTTRADDETAVASYAAAASALPGVEAGTAPRQLDARTWQLDLVATGDPSDGPAQQLVRDLRALDPPAGLRAQVTGPAAAFVDQQQAIGRALPLGLALLVGLTLLVLWLMTGSVVLPVKAVVMNALTVGTALGALTVVYQGGRLTGLLGYTPNGGVEPTDFLVTAAVVFALSTDYGVFLLGRIKEQRDGGSSEREAVAEGLQRTGAVVTAAAILLAVAIGAFSTSSISFIQQIGVASAFAVLVDAFVVRSLLVPSLMGLLGRWNWWAPMPLRRLHDRITVDP